MPLTSMSLGARRGDEVRAWCGWGDGGYWREELDECEWRGGSRIGSWDVIVRNDSVREGINGREAVGALVAYVGDVAPHGSV